MIRSVGSFGDTESLDLLEAYLADSSPGLAAILLDSIGKIGGQRARELLEGGSEKDQARLRELSALLET